MKLSTMVMGVGVGAFALVGCGTDSATKTPAEKLIGSWHKDCYLPSDAGHYRTIDVTFKDDNTLSGKKIKYDDMDCTENPHEYIFSSNYTVGGTTKGDDGKEAYELDESWTGGEAYKMFRFQDNGNLLISGSRDGHDGSTKEKRRDHFGTNWTGFKKQ